jgi:hypothetical protein
MKRENGRCWNNYQIRKKTRYVNIAYGLYIHIFLYDLQNIFIKEGS